MITPYGELPNRLAKDMTLQEQHEWLQRKVSRRRVIAGLAVGASGLLGPTLWQQSAAADERFAVRGRHIAYGQDPTSEITVEFTTSAAFRRAHVVAAYRGEVHARPDAVVATVRGSTRRYCRSTFTGLTADRNYDYHVVTDGRRVAQGTFRTAFAGGRSFRFTAFGDQGIGFEPHRMLNRVGELNPRLHLMCGDLCYADSSGQGGPGDVFRPRRWDEWLDQNDRVAYRIPWMSVPGNHEMEPGFGRHGYAGYLTRMSPGGRSPLAIPVATTFRVGTVGFVGLDSNDVSYEIPANRGWTDHAQTRWLEQTLKALRAPGSGVDFIVCYLHHAPYSTNNTHASEGGIIQAWVPLFDRYSVDLVISGHNHCYERARPLRAGKIVGDSTTEVDSSHATTYITAGGGGAGGEAEFIPYPDKTRVAVAGGEEVVTEHWSLPTKTARPSVLCVDVTPTASGNRPSMQVRAISASGAELDRVTLSRAATSAPGTLEPWVLSGSAGLVAIGSTAAAIAWRQRAKAKTT